MDNDLEALFEELEQLTTKPINRQDIVKAPFPWAGSKSDAIDKISPYLPYYDGYAEPFGGSGAMWLSRRRSKLEIFNDACSGVTDFYKCIRDTRLKEVLCAELETMIHSREEWIDCKDWIDTKDIVERAAKWYYLVYYSFSGRGDAFGRCLHTINTKKHHNNLCLFDLLHDRVKGTIIENLDFRTFIKDYAHYETVMYLDPPYLETTHSSYFGNSFTLNDHKDMLGLVFSCESFCAVSGHENFLYDSYPWDNIIKWEQTRTIRNNTNQHSDTRIECLYIKERK